MIRPIELVYVVVVCASLLFATLQTAAHVDARNALVVKPYGITVLMPIPR